MCGCVSSAAQAKHIIASASTALAATASACCCCLCRQPLLAACPSAASPSSICCCPCPGTGTARKGISNVKISAASRYYVASSQDLCKTVAELLCKLQPITWQMPDSRTAPPPLLTCPFPPPACFTVSVNCTRFSYMTGNASNNYTVQHSLCH